MPARFSVNSETRARRAPILRTKIATSTAAAVVESRCFSVCPLMKPSALKIVVAELRDLRSRVEGDRRAEREALRARRAVARLP